MARPPPSSTSVTNPSEIRSERAPLGRTDLLLIFAFWTLIALLICANSLIDRAPLGLQPAPMAQLALAFIESYIWAIVTPLVFVLAGLFPLERERWLPHLALHFCVGFVIAATVDTVSMYFRFDVFHASPAHFTPASPLWRFQHLAFINRFLIYVAVLSAGVARDYYLRYRARREQSILLQTEASQLQAQLVDAQLSMLRTQLNPHFLFNTLDAVSALVERDPRGVRRIIARLSELLRSSLERPEKREVALGQEVTFAQRYLEVMQIRSQGSLMVRAQTEPAALDALVPQRILQPLVELAVTRALRRVDGAAWVEIHARRDAGRLTFGVRDNGMSFMGGNGTGANGVSEEPAVRDTRERLESLYGADQALTTQVAADGVMSMEIVVPYRRAELEAPDVAARERRTL